MYLNETAITKLEELTHAGDPYLDKNLTKGFFNNLTGKADQIQTNRNIIAQKIRQLRKERDSLNNFIKNVGQRSKTQENLKKTNLLLQGFKQDPSYYLRTGYLPLSIAINNSTQSKQLQPAYATI